LYPRAKECSQERTPWDTTHSFLPSTMNLAAAS
jgi:hypothetical protein